MFERFHRELLNFLARQVGDRDLAADLTQESYVRALTLQGSGQTIGDARALLYRIARNLLVDEHRRAQVRQHEVLDTLDTAGEGPALQAPAHLQPDQILAYEQQARALVATIEALPPRCREAFVMNRLDGLSHQQVAERMGISRNMVVQHVVRALLACRACIDGPAAGAGGGTGK